MPSAHGLFKINLYLKLFIYDCYSEKKINYYKFLLLNMLVKMEMNKEFAEILGMFAADGCIQYPNYICMWGNIYEDKEYYDNVVCPLFSNVFGKKIVAHEKKSNSVYGFYICNKEIIEVFKKLRFSNNKTYNVRVPKEILESEDEEIIAAFIRGFTDCDGCLNFVKRYEKGYCEFKRKFHTYPRIFIGVVSEGVIDDISHLLQRLGINHSKHRTSKKKENEADVHRIVVRGNERVEKWKEKIGFNNEAKIMKYLIWKKFGFCPANTNINQRRLILRGELDPRTLYDVD